MWVLGFFDFRVSGLGFRVPLRSTEAICQVLRFRLWGLRFSVWVPDVWPGLGFAVCICRALGGMF